jgi:hypothetical protein
METKRGRGMAALVGVAALAATLAGSVPATAAPNTGRLSFTFGNDITTAYFFRGILQERHGLIEQPYGEVGVKLYENEDGPLNGVSLFFGTWNSIHSEQTAAVSGPDAWYESDEWGGIKANLFGNTEAKLSYIFYNYPSGAFSTVQEVDFSVGLDDSQWLGTFALNPAVLLAAETKNTALGTDRGWYLQPSIRPAFTILQSDTYPVTLALPVTLGLGLDNYFDNSASDDETFGYLQGGAVLSVPLAFIPEDYGAWSVSAGASIYTFGSNLQALNQGNDPWVVGTWSIGMTY